ncbi:MAG: hypothetical protein PF589_11095 [Gammaproteobacteria bacterium]|nr:hypothetical protein [Gammaproteobacteria bacterium]
MGHDLNNKPDNKSESGLKSEPKNKPENKKHTLFFLVMVMLAIVALGWSIGYLMSVNLSSRIESPYSGLSGSGQAFYIATLLPLKSEKFSEVFKAE